MDRPYVRTLTRTDRVALIRHTGSNEVRFSGIDYGNGNKPILIVRETPDIIVVKIPGGTHWNGLYQPWRSHPGQYLVLLKLDDGWVTELTSFPIKTSTEVEKSDE